MSNERPKGIKVGKKDLLSALTTLRLNVQPSEISDTSQYTIFQNGRIHAFNDFTGMTIPFISDIPNCAVEANLLYEFVRGVPDSELVMGIVNDALKIQGASKKGDSAIYADFAIRDDIIYPQEIIEVDVDEYNVLPASFALSLLYTAFACDGDDSISSRVVIKDGYAYSKGSLAVCEFYLGDEAIELIKEPIYVSPEAVGFVNRDAPKKYLSKNNWLHLINEDGVIYTSRMRADINFPFDAIKEMLDEPTSNEFRFPATIKDILQRCTPFSGYSQKVRKVDILMRDGNMDLTAERQDGSKFAERAKVVTKEDIRFAVNLKALNDIIELAEKYKTDGYRLLGYGTNFRTMVSLEAMEY